MSAHRYDDLESTIGLNRIIEEIDQDPTGISFG